MSRACQRTVVVLVAFRLSMFFRFLFLFFCFFLALFSPLAIYVWFCFLFTLALHIGASLNSLLLFSMRINFHNIILSYNYIMCDMNFDLMVYFPVTGNVFYSALLTILLDMACHVIRVTRVFVELLYNID